MKLFFEVESSAIKGLNRVDGDLYALFKGNLVYRYKDVSKELYHALFEAESLGKLFNKKVRNSFEVEAIGSIKPIFVNEA